VFIVQIYLKEENIHLHFFFVFVIYLAFQGDSVIPYKWLYHKTLNQTIYIKITAEKQIKQ